MDNKEKLLRELIDALGFEIGETKHVKKNNDGVEIPWEAGDRYETDYKLTKKQGQLYVFGESSTECTEGFMELREKEE